MAFSKIGRCSILRLASTMKSIRPRHSPDITPAKSSSRPSGRTLRHREGVNRGCADRPLSNGEVVAKFFDNADRAVPRRAAEHIRDAVLDFDRENARSLADALCATS